MSFLLIPSTMKAGYPSRGNIYYDIIMKVPVAAIGYLLMKSRGMKIDIPFLNEIEQVKLGKKVSAVLNQEKRAR